MSVNIVPLVVNVAGLNDYPAALSYSQILVAITALISEKIALALRSYDLKEPYSHYQYFVGSCYIAGLILLFL